MIPTTLEVFQVGSTPAFFVNGKIVLGGTVLAEAFKSIIDALLKLVAQQGVAPADFHEQVVIAKARRSSAREAIRSRRDQSAGM